MALAISIKAFEDAGITLIPPTVADFDALAAPLIGRVAPIGLKLKPMLAIVSNDSADVVVSYSKTWTVRYAGGRTNTIPSHTNFPDVVCGDTSIGPERDRHALPPGAKRVETANVVIHGYAEHERTAISSWIKAAADAQRRRRKFTDEELPALLRTSIRLDPFVVRPSKARG